MSEIQKQTRLSVCQKHGEYSENGITLPEGLAVDRKMVMWLGCLACKEEKQQESERREKSELYRRIMSSAGIPKRYLDATLGNYEPSKDNAKAYSRIKEFCGDESVVAKSAESGRCLLMVGAYGTGKTHLACGIVKAFALAGKSARYTTLLDMICTYKSCYDDNGPRERDVLSHYRSPSLLVIDEVGLQAGSEADMRIINTILDGRYNAMNCTILVSNFTAKELADQLGDRIIDRLRDNGGMLAVFTGESRRG